MYRANKRRGGLLGLAAALGAVVLLAAAVLLLAPREGQESPSSAGEPELYDSGAVQGPPEGFAGGLAGGDGRFGYRLNTRLRFASASGEAWLLAESSEQNQGILRVIIRDEAGENLCKTGFIRPGWHLPKTRLLGELKPGSYSATAYLQVIDPQTLQELCVLQQPVTVEVLG